MNAENKAIHELLNNVTKGNVVRSVDKNYINTRKNLYMPKYQIRGHGNREFNKGGIAMDKSYATVNDIHNFVNYSKDIKKNRNKEM